jgi:hypothetical protein
MWAGVGPKSKKIDFFSYSSSNLYKDPESWLLSNNTVLPSKKLKLKIRLKKFALALMLIILSILIKSLFQYYLGAQQTSLQIIISGLDYSFYEGCFLGAILMIFFKDNINNIWEFCHNSLTLKFDSGDENSGDEGLSNRKDKGKGKLIEKSISSQATDNEGSSKQTIDQETSSNLSEEEKQKKIEKQKLVQYIFESSLAAYEINKDTQNYIDNYSALGKGLGIFDTLNFEILNINNKNDVEKFFITLLQHHGSMYTNYHKSRSGWVLSRSINLQPENYKIVKNHLDNVDIAFAKYLSAIRTLDNYPDVTAQAKIYYAALNQERNTISKELNKADEIIFKDLKNSRFCNVDHKDCRNLKKMLENYNKAKLEFNTIDAKLKKKLGEAINKK